MSENLSEAYSNVTRMEIEETFSNDDEQQKSSSTKTGQGKTQVKTDTSLSFTNINHHKTLKKIIRRR